MALELETTPYATMHRHTYYEFHIQLQGTIRHLYNDSVDTIYTGDVILISPHLAHQYEADLQNNSESKYLNLAMTKETLFALADWINFIPIKTFISDMGLYMKFHLDKTNLEKLLMNFQEIEKKRNTSLTEEAYLIELKFFLISLLKMLYKSSKSSFFTMPSWLISFLDTLNDPQSYLLTINELAANINYSPNYLCTIFKKYMGCTMQEYLTAKKIDYATQLLLCTDDSVYTIAQKVGFNSQGHFAIIFKNIHKCSPSTYRKRHKTTSAS